MTSPVKERQQLDTQRFGDDVLRKVLSVTCNVPPPIYAPSDDSLLMIEALANLQVDRKKVLDMGTGSGILGLYCAMRGADVTATDIDELATVEAGRAARRLGVQLKLLVSDLFSHVPDRFDLILFNPPYLPSKDCQDRTIDGGPEGNVLTDRFLNDLPTHLDRGAQALLLLSSLNDPPSVQLRHSNFQFSTVARRSLFFEELRVLRVRLRDELAI
jgi:release factor glutamine methyltransferase